MRQRPQPDLDCRSKAMVYYTMVTVPRDTCQRINAELVVVRKEPPFVTATYRPGGVVEPVRRCKAPGTGNLISEASRWEFSGHHVSNYVGHAFCPTMLKMFEF